MEREDAKTHDDRTGRKTSKERRSNPMMEELFMAPVDYAACTGSATPCVSRGSSKADIDSIQGSMRLKLFIVSDKF